MININRLFKNNRLMRAITGLSIAGFQNLCEVFARALVEDQEKRYRNGLKTGTRQRQPGGGSKGKLNTIELKVLFILLYFKCYPTMDMQGFWFNLDRANVKRNVDKLTPLLETSLGKSLSLPKRKIRSMEEFLQLFPEAKDLFIDGTERPIQRPKNYQKQKQYYSGKKKGHTTKNIVISDETNKIGYVSPTVVGKTHDYTMFKHEFDPQKIPDNIAFWVDKGFTGMGKDFSDMDVVMPRKKPHGRELSDDDKEQNRIISGIRIVSEHAIGGAKRLRIVTDKFRNKSLTFNDQVFYLACGLWNYQLEHC
ncbi:transposase [Patescibacteria group bacterium AH-259-L07]|nr:transposase [Patescibacteria group bacterium AH-259-L07]